jgi:hypothetical protein
MHGGRGKGRGGGRERVPRDPKQPIIGSMRGARIGTKTEEKKMRAAEYSQIVFGVNGSRWARSAASTRAKALCLGGRPAAGAQRRRDNSRWERNNTGYLHRAKAKTCKRYARSAFLQMQWLTSRPGLSGCWACGQYNAGVRRCTLQTQGRRAGAPSGESRKGRQREGSLCVR